LSSIPTIWLTSTNSPRRAGKRARGLQPHWGQEYKRLAARFRELGVHEARFHIPDGITQFPFLAQWYGLTFDKNINPDILDSGWYVVSPTREKIKPLHGEMGSSTA
jgi:hypothetical protein